MLEFNNIKYHSIQLKAQVDLYIHMKSFPIPLQTAKATRNKRLTNTTLELTHLWPDHLSNV